MNKELLIVEDDLTFAIIMKTWLTKKGFNVHTASNCTKACEALQERDYSLILSDLRLPDGEGTSLLPLIKEKHPETPLIIMTSYADIQSAVNAMKLGASDYISKPIRPDELMEKIKEVLSKRKTEEKKAHPTQKQPIEQSDNDFMEGGSEAARMLYNYVSLVAPTQMSVLITGASGTGKEYAARRIHRLSKRNDRPFVAIDCGSIPKELAASEFFGHIKGSFTGALEDKRGAFIEADGGTLFLDEVGNLSYEVQVQLLRALQERHVRPVGSTKEYEVNVRIICATNEDLPSAIERGEFREDLYHRINEFTLQMPSLKERQQDIMLFADLFLDKANEEFGKHITGFDREATTLMLTYEWPGNLRQLKNVVKRAALLAQGDCITPQELYLPSTTPSTDTQAIGINLNTKATEKERIIEALRKTSNNKSKAAQLLGIDRKTLYNKLKLHGIE